MNTYTVKKVALADIPIDSPIWGEANKGTIANYPWNKPEDTVQTNFYMLQDENGIGMKFHSNEESPIGKSNGMNTEVYLDSCVEIFLNASPKTTDKYLNFELSVTGFMLFGIGSDRFDRELQYIDFDQLHIDTRILENGGWEAKFYIPNTLLKNYYPEISASWTGNFQKLCELCEAPHWGCWNLIGTEKPDFHRPEYFGKIELEQ